MMILSIDVEDYFMVAALSNVVKRADWDRYPLRIEQNTRRVLDILDEAASGPHAPGPLPPSSRKSEAAPGTSSPLQSATFFCLGWVAERRPALIREIHSRGHEVACHGYDHRMITAMTPGEFRQDIRKAKAVLEDITGRQVVGYRAPSYSITRKNLWALEILAEEGFLYDSSVFPVHHDLYGMPHAPRVPFAFSCNGGGRPEFSSLPESIGAPGPCGSPLSAGAACDSLPLYGTLPPHFPGACRAPYSPLAEGEGQGEGKAVQHKSTTHPPRPSCTMATRANKPWNLLEFPLSTLRLFGQNIPVAGGGYFRAFPLWFTRWAQTRTVRQTGSPFIFYLHPWELDPEQPRVKGLSTRSSFRHYLNLHKTESRLRQFLRGQTITSFKSLLSASA
jgi:hypothetical protein